MGKHSAPLPTSPAAVPRPSRRQLRAEYEQLYARYLELTGRYNDLLRACVRTGRVPEDTGAQTAWDRAVSSLEQDTTEEFPAPPALEDTVFTGGPS